MANYNVLCHSYSTIRDELIGKSRQVAVVAGAPKTDAGLQRCVGEGAILEKANIEEVLVSWLSICLNSKYLNDRNVSNASTSFQIIN